ncbi:MAG: TadE/TadG family type IV pilus assembly protein, partial [Parvularculaceae bacterium]
MRKLARKSYGFPRNKRGSSAVEFAIVAPVFLMLMFSTFEVGWFYFVNATLDSATANASRFVRTGQAQSGSMNKQDFFDLVCPSLDLFGDCMTHLTVEVAKFNTFADLAADTTPPVCRGDDPDAINNLAYEPGADNEIIRMRLCLIYNTLNPTIGINLADNGGT